MDGHQPAEDREEGHPGEATFPHESRNPLSAGIRANRGCDVAIRVRIPVEHPAQDTADNGQVGEVDRPHSPVRRTIEIERDRAASGLEHPQQFVDRTGQIRHVAQAVPDGDQIERFSRKGKARHVADHEQRPRA
jgi:hypothetical protein